MTENLIYLVKNGYTYIRAEPTEISREIESLKTVIRIAESRVSELNTALHTKEPDSEEFENSQEEINDIEMAIDDLKVLLGRLINIPQNAH